MSAESKPATTRTALHVDRLMARLKAVERERDAALVLAADRLEQMQADRAQALRWRDMRDEQQRTIEVLMCGMDDTTTPVIRRVAALEQERDRIVHQVICCGVAASHPDASLTLTGAYAAEWDSIQAQQVRELRAERDALRSVFNGGVSHIWQGSCPDYEDPLSRDPKCQACLAIGAARAAS